MLACAVQRLRNLEGSKCGVNRVESSRPPSEIYPKSRFLHEPPAKATGVFIVRPPKEPRVPHRSFYVLRPTLDRQQPHRQSHGPLLEVLEGEVVGCVA